MVLKHSQHSSSKTLQSSRLTAIGTRPFDFYTVKLLRGYKSVSGFQKSWFPEV